MKSVLTAVIPSKSQTPSSGLEALTSPLLHCLLVLPHHRCQLHFSPGPLHLLSSAWCALPQLTSRLSLSPLSSLPSNITFLVGPAPTTL